MTSAPAQLADQAKQAFQQKRFEEAARLFAEALHGYAQAQDDLNVAEMKNNQSVALLQAGHAQAALEAAANTDEYFASVKDARRQAFALGNQAAALDALKRYDEALKKYERSADLFAEAKDGDMRAVTLKAAAAIKLKTGKVADSAFKMMGSLEAKEKPSLFERILNFFLRFLR
ncbi:MAG: hypothetical protein IT310_08865 [Anaerolineales bacterium]|nr:hypothetical protein [Anaerolineales bacterium]